MVDFEDFVVFSGDARSVCAVMKMENKLEKTKRKLEIGSFSCPQNPDSSLSKVDFSILFYSNLYYYVWLENPTR